MQFAGSAASADERPTRLRGLETLRGLAAVLVIFLHAGIPYMTRPMTHLVWPARAPHPSPAVDAIVWSAECFLMPLFFVFGGFFSQGVLSSRGSKRFLAERTRRLLPTQMLLAFAILPACLVIWCLGWIADGLYVPQDWMNTGLPSELDADLWGVAHFWFLQNFYIYCLILYGLSRLVERWQDSEPSDRTSPLIHGLDRAMTSFWKPLVPAIPCALILLWDQRIVLGFYQQFIPVFSKFLYYSVYFFTGALMYRHGSSLQQYARYGRTYLVLAAGLFAALLPQIHEHLASPLTGARLALLAGMLAAFAWLTIFGLLGIFLQVRYENPVTRYLAEASFWVYLIHLPFVVLAHIALAPLPIPTEVKYLLAGTTGLTMALLTNEAFVRNKRLGWFLDGCRQRGSATPSAPAPVSIPMPIPEFTNPLSIPVPQPISANHAVVVSTHSVG